jgi:hypothetical protein
MSLHACNPCTYESNVLQDTLACFLLGLRRHSEKGLRGGASCSHTAEQREGDPGTTASGKRRGCKKLQNTEGAVLGS